MPEDSEFQLKVGPRSPIFLRRKIGSLQTVVFHGLTGFLLFLRGEGEFMYHIVKQAKTPQQVQELINKLSNLTTQFFKGKTCQAWIIYPAGHKSSATSLQTKIEEQKKSDEGVQEFTLQEYGTQTKCTFSLLSSGAIAQVANE